MERSVSRAELADESAPSSPESIAVDIKPHDFEFVQLGAEAEVDEAEDELSFRLFAPSKTEAVKDVQLIRLKSPTPDDKEAGFVVPRRDPSYYFSGEQQWHAVSGQDVRAMASISWPGTNYPWKVLTLSASQVSRSATQSIQAWSKLVTEPPKRRRKGKKARIKLRMALSIARTKAAEQQATQAAQDAAEREKKTRRNREKKMKQRQRLKAKKSAGVANADEDGEDST